MTQKCTNKNRHYAATITGKAAVFTCKRRSARGKCKKGVSKGSSLRHEPGTEEDWENSCSISQNVTTALSATTMCNPLGWAAKDALVSGPITFFAEVHMACMAARHTTIHTSFTARRTLLEGASPGGHMRPNTLLRELHQPNVPAIQMADSKTLAYLSHHSRRDMAVPEMMCTIGALMPFCGAVACSSSVAAGCCGYAVNSQLPK